MNAQSLRPANGSSPGPDGADDFFDSSAHLRTLRHLEQAIAQDDRLVVLTGDEGVGKSSVVQRLLRRFDGKAVWCVQLSATQLDTGELSGSLARAFGAPASAHSIAALHAGLRQHLASHAEGRSALAVIGDAQALTAEAIDEIGELTREGPLRMLLVGRPALRIALQRQLPLQPASLSCHLEPLQEAETPAYIAWRLRRIGGDGAPEFTDEAQALIHRFSRGVPRRINRLCDRLLVAARQRKERTIDGTAVRRIARPRLDDNTIPLLTSAVEEPLPSGWGASSHLPPEPEPPPQQELPRWAHTASAPAASAGMDARSERGSTLHRRRGALAAAALMAAAAFTFWVYRAFEVPRFDATMTTSTPAPPNAPAASPAPISGAAPARDATQEPPRPAAVPPRAAATEQPPVPAATEQPPVPAATQQPPVPAGTPVAPPAAVPGPCTATVAALGLCTPREGSP